MFSAAQQPQDQRPADTFVEAIQHVVRLIGAVWAPQPTPISRFKSSYGGVLKEADKGTVQVISQGDKRYVLMTEEQLIAVAGASTRRHTLADTLESITPPSQAIDTRIVALEGAGYDPFTLPERAARNGR